MTRDREYRDALEAVLEALNVPHAATVGDEETRTGILLERVGHAVVMLKSILHEKYPAPGMPWSVAYLRARLAEHPATGYKTWDERVVELECDEGHRRERSPARIRCDDPRPARRAGVGTARDHRGDSLRRDHGD